ncbi:MAG TPA: DMT family transporter [Solimonas sp.]
MSFGPGELYSLGCAMVWALAVILYRKSGESLPPFALNLVKNAAILPLFLLTIRVVQGWQWPMMPLSHWLLIGVSGLLGIAIADTLYFRALNMIGPGRIAAAQTLYSPFVILLSLAFLGERLSLGQFVGIALVLGGIALVTYARSGAPVEARRLLIGAAWGVLAVFLMAVGVVLAKPMLEQHDFLWVVALRIAGGLLGMLAIAAVRRQFGALRQLYAGVRHWGVIAAAGFTGSYVSMMLWLAGYKYTQASIAAVLNELAAVFILLLTVFVLRERVAPRQWLGTLLAVAGVVVVVSF